MNILLIKQKQQRVAVGPGNAHFISIRQVSSDAVTLRRGTCGHGYMARRCCCRCFCCSSAASAAADTALDNMLINN